MSVLLSITVSVLAVSLLSRLFWKTMYFSLAPRRIALLWAIKANNPRRTPIEAATQINGQFMKYLEFQRQLHLISRYRGYLEKPKGEVISA